MGTTCFDIGVAFKMQKLPWITAIFMTGLNNCLCKNVDVVYVSVTQYGLAFENGFLQSSHRQSFPEKYVLGFERPLYAWMHFKSLVNVKI